MGLFDTLTCDYPMPDPEFQHLNFQTKDLGSTLTRYHITVDGRLWRLRQGVDFFEENIHPPDPTDKVENMNYHGDFSFYTNDAKEWLKYRIRFTRGTVEWIRREGEEDTVAADSLTTLARDAKDMEREWTARLAGFLQRLEVLDAEVVKRVIKTFGDRTKAARWLATAQRGLNYVTPYQTLAQGRRQAVLDALQQIK